MLWENLRADQFVPAIELSKGVCAMAVGCVEKHGLHLPLGCDVLHSSGVLELAAEKEPVCVFPKMYFGEKQGAGEFPGTIIFSSKLLFDILTESCAEMGRNGFKKIVLVSGHGGNTAMLNNFARSVLYKKNDYMVFVYSASSAWPKVQDMLDIIDAGDRDYFPELTDEDIATLRNYIKTNTVSGHGCLMETAIMLGLHPELVDLTKVNDESGASTHYMDRLTQAGYYTPFAWMANYPNSYSSDAHDGNNERIGRSAVKYAVEKMAGALKILKDDVSAEEYHARWLLKQK